MPIGIYKRTEEHKRKIGATHNRFWEYEINKSAKKCINKIF